MKHYSLLLEEIRTRIINDEKTSKLGIGASKNWKQREYELLANAIGQSVEDSTLLQTEKDKLGLTISVTTLERIFKHGYKFGNSIDKRQEKTLSKLCIYLGHHSFAEFQAQFDNRSRTENDILQLLLSGNQAEFNAYKNLPEIDLSELELYYHREGPAFKRVEHLLQLNAKRHWVLSDPKNPSYHRILAFEIVSKSDTEMEIKTRENWYLRWFHTVDKNNPFIYDELNTQFYLLSLKGGKWKVELNHYETKNTTYSP